MAVVNQKGGVGKTTTAVNLAAGLAAAGRKVLLIDLDPQGNASTGLGFEAGQRRPSSGDFLQGAAPQEVVRPSVIPGLTVIPACDDLLAVERDLAALPAPAHALRAALARLPDGPDGPEWIFADCPPGLSLLTINALAALPWLLIPLQCEFFALEGLSQILRTVEQTRASLNPALAVHGVLMTMFDRRNRLSAQVAEDVRAHLGAQVYRTMIPRNVRLSEAPSHGKPALLYDRDCAGSRAYLELAGEILDRHSRIKTRGPAACAETARAAVTHGVAARGVGEHLP